jgi:hypothetical protein
MPDRKERPLCRREIERMLGEERCSLEDLLKHPHRISDGIRIQARKCWTKSV